MLQRFLLPAAAAVLLQVSIALAADPSAPAATQRSVSLDDIAATKTPGDPNFSPDGKLIAYALDDRIYVVPADRGVPRTVTSAGSKAWDPRWSRDGRTLYFLSDRGGTSQLWKLPVEGFGEATQVTTFEHGIESLNPSPDESKLLLRFTESALKEPAGKDAKAAKKEKSPSPGSSRGSNSRKTPATVT